MPLHKPVELILAEDLATKCLCALDSVPSCTSCQDHSDVPTRISRPPNIDAAPSIERIGYAARILGRKR